MTPSLLQDLVSGETVAKDLLLLGSRAQPQNNQAAGSPAGLAEWGPREGISGLLVSRPLY